ncbi:hypothetical protein PN836_016540 [Ningiella sp. W23]|uniref:hypothetical protein n=1 Tax=Ningiella sp. W23 TaxID=3023715 RepID=UPI00375835FA
MFYLCTGFHRSGTSLLAQTLQANGINMGMDLMGATYANPLGHVEDMPMVRLHDKIYKLNGADWRYHDSSPLIKPVWLPNYIQNYLNNREEVAPSVLKGGKDPRAVHFLKDWQVAAKGKIKYIFIYRHWREASFSLLNRHSRHFLNTAHPMQKSQVNLSFWQQPSLAFDMWLSANKRILDFYKVHSENAVLMSQEQFVLLASKDQHCVFDKFAAKIGLNASHFDAKTLEKGLITNTLPDYAHNGISEDLVEQLDSLYSALNGAADLPNQTMPRAKDKSPYMNISVPLFFSQVCRLIKMLEGDSETRTSSSAIKNVQTDNIFAQANFDFSNLAWPEFTGALLRLPIARLSPKPFYSALSCDIDFLLDGQSQAFSVSQGDANKPLPISSDVAEYYYSLAKVAHYKGVWLVCSVFQMRAMLCDAATRTENPWDIRTWEKFVHQDDWLTIHDRDLKGDNPFKLRPIFSLPEYYTKRIDKLEALNNLSLQALFELLQDDANMPVEHLAKHRLIEAWLLLNTPSSDALAQIKAYFEIAEKCHDSIDIVEFCFMKALRCAFAETENHKGNVQIVLCLSRLFAFYASQKMFLYAKALAQQLSRCSAEALSSCNDDSVGEAIFNSIKDLITQYHFTQAQEYINTLGKFLHSSDEIRSNKKAELVGYMREQKDALRPAKGLKHRFALLPHSLSYEHILNAGDEAPERGKALDFLNQRLSFLAKDNIEWLSEGLVGINENAANSLMCLIDKHWRKLWTPATYQYLFNETAQSQLQQINVNTSKRAETEFAACNACIIVRISCVESFTVFLDLLQSQAPNISLHCIVIEDRLEPAEREVLQKMLVASKQSFKISFSPASLFHKLLASLIEEVSKQYDIIGLAQCSAVKLHLDKLKQVACWYSLLGFETGALHMLQTLKDENQALAMLIPNYHPSDLAAIQDKPLFYPEMHMCWLASAAIENPAMFAAQNALHRVLISTKKGGGQIKLTSLVLQGEIGD